MSALNVRVNLCTNGCDTLNLYDITGTASTSNTGGYGGSNPTSASLTVTEITLTDPAGTAYTYPISSYAWSTEPNPTEDTEEVIASFSISTDGVYTITYVMTNSSALGQPEYRTTCSFLISCLTEACLDAKLLETKSIDCGCDNNAIDRLMVAYLMLEGAKDSATCGKTTEATNKLNLVQDYCGFVRCDTCD